MNSRLFSHIYIKKYIFFKKILQICLSTDGETSYWFATLSFL